MDAEMERATDSVKAPAVVTGLVSDSGWVSELESVWAPVWELASVWEPDALAASGGVLETAGSALLEQATEPSLPFSDRVVRPLPMLYARVSLPQFSFL
jgi:hypothetical protein